jgi:hypothetical protein
LEDFEKRFAGYIPIVRKRFNFYIMFLIIDDRDSHPDMHKNFEF